MLDTIQAALHFTNGYIYFFKGNHYIKWRLDHGVMPLPNGRILRRLGVDGWTQLPTEFHSGIDAAFYYSPNKAVYFFKGNHFVMWKHGGPVARNGSILHTIGVDGWQTLPTDYQQGFDAVIFHEEHKCAYFFKNATYVKYKPDSGVETANGKIVRQLGIDGWGDLPLRFQSGVDTAVYYRAKNSRIYFFKGRQYVRWNTVAGQECPDPSYPRRIGLGNGTEMKNGWPGLSHILAGPLVGHTTESETRVWVWLSDLDTANRIRVRLNNILKVMVPRKKIKKVNPVSPELEASVDAEHPGSVIRQYIVKGLRAGVTNHVDLILDNTVLESLQVQTPPPPSECGDVKLAFGSCIRFTVARGRVKKNVPVLQALSEWQPDLILFCGDNCYYLGIGGGERHRASEPIDWAHTNLMLRRQMQARNHPMMADLLLRGPVFSTWDDHDFGFDNATGAEPEASDWVGRKRSGQVFRAFWPNDYINKHSNGLRHAFRWGPIHVFMPDARYYKSPSDHRIWSNPQLNWLVKAMRHSDAPLKIVVTAGQFLSSSDGKQEGHYREAPRERRAFLNGIQGKDIQGNPSGDPVSGRVLILSGDVHYTSLVRANEEDGAIMEFTSSAVVKYGGHKSYPAEFKGATCLWANKKTDNFGAVNISINGIKDGRVLGEVIFEARDGEGKIIMDTNKNRLCQTTWDLDTGAIS